MKTINLKYRTWYKGEPPKPIKLEIPGWAGSSMGHSDGDKPQPWHCVPFVDGSTYGLELVYPFDTECHIVNENGKIKVLGDFTEEQKEVTKVSPNTVLPPFSQFAPNHYGFTSSIDIKTEEGYVVRIEPHPKFYADDTGTVPLPVPGHINGDIWPRIFFIVFKIPPLGCRHVFRKNEPYAQILILPKKINYEIKKMSDEEITEREFQEAELTRIGSTFIASHSWIDHEGNNFDDKYKILSTLHAKEGMDAVKKVYHGAQIKELNMIKENERERQKNQKKMPKKFIKPSCPFKDGKRK